MSHVDAIYEPLPYADLLRLAATASERSVAARCEIDSLAQLDALNPWFPDHPHRTRCEGIRARLVGISERIAHCVQHLVAERTRVFSESAARSPFVCPPTLQTRLNAVAQMIDLVRSHDGISLLVMSRRPELAGMLSPEARDLISTAASAAAVGARRAAEAAADKVAYPHTRFWHTKVAEAMRTIDFVWPRVAKELLRCDVSLRQERSTLLARHTSALSSAIEVHLGTPRIALMAALADSAETLGELDVLRAQEAAAVEAMRRIWLGSADVAHHAFSDAPPLNVLDLQLVAIWARDFGGTPYWIATMESARGAELVALQTYRDLYGQAEDVSVLQVDAPLDLRWKKADVVTAGRWIDVKNARRSYSSPNSYSEYAVKQFKQQENGQGVVVSGFLSPYEAGHGPAVWLGETSWETIADLRHEFKTEYLDLHFDRASGNRLPPWLFEYPPTVYQQRDAALAFVRAREFVIPRQDCPLSMRVLVGCAISSSHANTGLDEARALCQRLKENRLPTRPRLFLHVLDRFCQTARAGIEFPAKALRELLVPKESAALADCAYASTPLGAFDPLETVTNLVDVLAKIDRACRKEALAFTKFRFPGVGIFQGLSSKGNWHTLFAYCGGWRTIKDGRVKCGQNPLFLGQDASCDQCGKLACHVCGFCSQTCAECATRQARKGGKA